MILKKILLIVSQMAELITATAQAKQYADQERELLIAITTRNYSKEYQEQSLALSKVFCSPIHTANTYFTKIN
jgi:hypothetical protein